MTSLYEDNHIIVVNKSVGDIVQGDKTGDVPLSDKVKAYVKERYAKPGNVFLGVVHRLDRPASGAVVFARTSKALARLNAMFASHKAVSKTYWAVVTAQPPAQSGTLTHWITRNEKANVSRAHDHEVPGSQEATLDYKVLCRTDRYWLVEIALHTGRHHQIRCQLAKIGCPIRGDLKYGAKRSNPDGGISLHARRLVFRHPVTQSLVDVTAPLPQESLWQAVAKAMGVD